MNFSWKITARLYPRAHENRVSGTEEHLRTTRRRFFTAAAINFLLLQLTFLCLFAYIFGSLYQQNTHVHNLNVLYVDYDGGAVGQAIREGYDKVRGDTFPSLIEADRSLYPTNELERVTCQTKYFAVLYTSPGASTRLQAALSGGGAATLYNRSAGVTFIWNEARYSTTLDAAIQANLQTLSTEARGLYLANNTIRTLSVTDPAAVAIFATPWTLSNINIQPTTQGSRAIYNTLVIILIIIQEFFYLGTINGLYASFKIYGKLYPHRMIIARLMISLSYTFVGSLCTTGMIFAFRNGWNLNGNQFILCWMTFWLFAHSNFLVLDILTVWVPQVYVPMALITWMNLNVSSILLPFELSPAFYRWGYALPAHEVYITLIDIWSRGCNPVLHISFPILFSWEMVGLFGSVLGVYRRAHLATIAKENEEREFQEKISAAVAFEHKSFQAVEKQRGGLEKQRSPSTTDMGVERDAESGGDGEERNREGLEKVMRQEYDAIEKARGQAKEPEFGPCFDLAYRTHEG